MKKVAHSDKLIDCIGSWSVYEDIRELNFDYFSNYKATSLVTLTKLVLDNRYRYIDKEYEFIEELILSEDANNSIIAFEIIKSKM